MSNENDAGMSPPTSALWAADITTAERSYRTAHGTDFTEIKEAMVDALLRLTEQHCTGEGPDGAIIYGSRPSSRLVSAFLLPRYDRTGTEDETSDIHLATMGMDLQVVAGVGGEVIIAPELSIYVRELPTWAEISDPRHDIMPQVQLSREARQDVENRARRYIDERIADLPPLEEETDPDRAGEALAQAEREHERADVPDETTVTTETAEARGIARAAAETAERAERAAAAHQSRTRQRIAARNERNSAIAAIRREAFDRVFAELGINIVTGSAERRPLSSDDLAESEQTQIVESGIEDAREQDASADASEPQPADGPPPAAGAVGPLRPGTGRIDDHFAAPQPIPQKWRRVSLQLGSFRFDIADEVSREEAVAAFEAALQTQITEVLTAWLATEEGQRDAYRPNERVLPSNFANEVSWNNYLAALRARRPATLDDVRPDLTGLTLVADLDADFSDPARLNLRVALQNDASMPSGRDSSAFEHAVFQVALHVTLSSAVHLPLRLDRLKPSYRFSDWFEYAAMGLNCGVRQVSASEGAVALRTTWAPRYVQPRIEPNSIAGVPTSYVELADLASDPARLLALPDEYDRWIESQIAVDAGAGLEIEAADEERRSHALDIEAYRRESRYIRAGIALLQESRAAFLQLEAASHGSQERTTLARRAAPWIAWGRTNESFAAYGGQRYTDWRLFQLAFILAHLPTLASRMPEYHGRFDAFRDELSASLLYFPTGGGKSEAFFGLLIFNLFFDRLRGKERGVTALVRYPLRLLTLQQARRLTRILVQAELVRLRHGISGWPFEIGFWVGSGNTPNRAAQGFGGVPAVTVAVHADDTALLNPSQAASEAAAKERRRSARYVEALESYDKLRQCPCCGAPTGMRRYHSQHGRIGIVCFNDATCDWNRLNPPGPHRVPLPFILTDDTIYQRAPSIVLGTIDKLALIGQHDRTINLIAGMFGAARYIDPQSRHLFVPRGTRALARAEDEGLTRLRPSFAAGAALFHDPFPSLIIQDEGHLLDESLGTFSGLFETTLETIFTRLGNGLLREQVAMWPGTQAGGLRPRLAKVIAATATISDPDRQLKVLYQREPLRFPCPGPNLYESFYALPRQPLDTDRRALAETLPAFRRPEITTPRMRVYVSMMTNGRSHTMTTSAVVSAYHLSFTRIWRLIDSGDCAQAVQLVAQSLTADDPLTPVRRQALTLLLAEANGPQIFATLFDLLRISLTYVTNKKGGDQIIETLAAQVERDQRGDGITDLPFVTDLISGGVTIAEIQDVMAKAEQSASPGAPFLPLAESLRNIVATSAISHGVDVDKFNAMFFAGLPSDIAEYIQASSRVGRTHVGFSLFVPTPHSRRDRYVVETHDQFHRFLERMIPPPAVQRWADRALRRIMPSILQAYLCGLIEQELFARAPDDDKSRARTFTTPSSIKAWAGSLGGDPAAIAAVRDFAIDAVGVNGRGETGIGATTHAEHYGLFVEDRMREIVQRLTYRSDPGQLSNFWKTSGGIKPPMTSLRDVDAAGVILGSTHDPYRRKRVHLETIRHVMRVIRGQRLASRSDIDADLAPVDAEDR
jgi:hypothetical protein